MARPPKSNERPSTYDARREPESANDSRRTVWSLLADRYPDEVQERMVELVRDGGTASFADINSLELAEVLHLLELRDDAANVRKHYVKELKRQVKMRGKGGRGITAAQRAEQIAGLESEVQRHTKTVLDIGKLLGSKLRHLRLVTERSGGGATNLEDMSVAIPSDLADRIDEAEVDYDLDLTQPVEDPGG